MEKEYTYVCIGLNVFGIGVSIEDAHAKAQSEYGRKLKTYYVYRYLKESNPRVMNDGSIESDWKGEKSVMVAKVKKGKSVL